MQKGEFALLLWLGILIFVDSKMEIRFAIAVKSITGQKSSWLVDHRGHHNHWVARILRFYQVTR